MISLLKNKKGFAFILGIGTVFAVFIGVILLFFLGSGGLQTTINITQALSNIPTGAWIVFGVLALFMFLRRK